jgi:subtilisin family serine protease
MFADMWYKGTDEVTVQVTAPNGTTSFQNSTGSDPNNFETRTSFGTIFVDCPDTPNTVNGDRECIFGVDDSGNALPAAGKWTVSITGTSVPGGGRYDIWIADATKGRCTWGWDTPSTGSSVSIPGTSVQGITVGAYLTKTSWTNVAGKMIGYNDLAFVIDNIAPFSSTGPTRDGRVKPDIAAPGMGIASTKASVIPTGRGSEGRLRTVEDGKHLVLEGTSMSAPHVAGAVALLLSINPLLDSQTLHDILTENASLDSFTGGVPNPAWGFGKLDVLAAANDPRTTGAQKRPPTPIAAP